MKYTASAVVLFCVMAFGLTASGTIKESDLKKDVTLTQGALLLQQVDTVSLYLSSDRAAFAPRLKGGVIEVEVTVLAPNLIADRAKLKDFVARQIGAFNSVLKERLPVYAPAVAKSYDEKTDIVFIVNEGANRSPVGIWKGGAWQSEAAPVAIAAAEAVPVEPAKAGKAAKAAKEAPAPEVPATDINATRAEETGGGKPGRKGCNCPARQ